MPAAASTDRADSASAARGHRLLLAGDHAEVGRRLLGHRPGRRPVQRQADGVERLASSHLEQDRGQAVAEQVVQVTGGAQPFLNHGGAGQRLPGLAQLLHQLGESDQSVHDEAGHPGAHDVVDRHREEAGRQLPRSCRHARRDAPDQRPGYAQGTRAGSGRPGTGGAQPGRVEEGIGVYVSSAISTSEGMCRPVIERICMTTITTRQAAAGTTRPPGTISSALAENPASTAASRASDSR